MASCGTRIRPTPRRRRLRCTPARRGRSYFCWRWRARRATIPTQKEPGLYAGLAGTGFTLGEAYLVTSDDRYRTAALECVKLLQDTATTIGRGAQWIETTDYRLYQTTRD